MNYQLLYNIGRLEEKLSLPILLFFSCNKEFEFEQMNNFLGK